MSGNDSSELPNPQFLLDESLDPNVAKALEAVGYDIVDVKTAMDPDKEGRQILDAEIIEWCRMRGSVWIHADDRARRDHKKQLQTSGIRTLLVRRPGGRMTGREQLRILAFVIPQLLDRYNQSPRIRHYRTGAVDPLSRPSLRPVEI
ncbi:MAG: hypothetical protein F4Y35_03810 [Chloroflexi bacterium]|nr:hypothetical protein [Chloroflexota bacterium]